MIITPPVDLSGALERRLLNASHDVLLLGSDPFALLDTWIIIYSVSQVVLLLLIGTLWVKRGGTDGGRSWRGLTLINMLWTMFLNTVVVCMLYYAGEQANPNPPTGLCLAQATLKHGTGPMTQVAILSLGIETFLSTRATITPRKQSALGVALLLSAPYAAFVVWAIPVGIMGLLSPIHIERLDQAYYCSYANDLYGNISTVFGVLLILATAVMQAITARILHRTWRATRELRASGGIDLGLIVRLWVFVALQILFILLTVIDIDLQPKSARYVLGQIISIFEALVPIAAFVIFGMRTAVLEVWFWWWQPRSRGSGVRSSTWVISAGAPARARVPPKGPVGLDTLGLDGEGDEESQVGEKYGSDVGLVREAGAAYTEGGAAGEREFAPPIRASTFGSEASVGRASTSSSGAGGSYTGASLSEVGLVEKV